MTAVVMAGYFGAGNLGDDAIADVQARMLRAIFDPLELVLIGGSDPLLLPVLHDRIVPWRDAVAIHRAVSECDLVIIGGGGIVNVSQQKSGLIYTDQLRDFSAMIMSLPWLARTAGKHSVLMNAGSHLCVPPHAEQYLSQFCELCDTLMVRDARTQAFLSAASRRSDVQKSYDSVFYLAVDGRFQTQQITLPVGRPVRVFLSVRSLGQRNADLVNGLANALALVHANRPIEVAYLLHQQQISISDPNYYQDGQIVAALQERCQDIPFTPIEAGPTLESMIDAIASCDVAVNLRYHGVIFAALAGVPSVAVYEDNNDPKFSELFADIEANTFLLHFDHKPWERLPNLLETLIENREVWSSRIHCKVAEFGARIANLLRGLAPPFLQRPLTNATVDELLRESGRLTFMPVVVKNIITLARRFLDCSDFALAKDFLLALPREEWIGEVYYLYGFILQIEEGHKPAEERSYAIANEIVALYTRANELRFSRFWVHYMLAQQFLAMDRPKDAMLALKIALNEAPLEVDEGMRKTVEDLSQRIARRLLPPEVEAVPPVYQATDTPPTTAVDQPPP